MSKTTTYRWRGVLINGIVLIAAAISSGACNHLTETGLTATPASPIVTNTQQPTLTKTSYPTATCTGTSTATATPEPTPTEPWPYKQEFVSSAGVTFTIDSLPEGVPEDFIGFVESPDTDRILNRILYIIQTGDVETTDEQAIRDYFNQPGTVDFLYAKKDPSEPDKPYRITVEREEIERNRVHLNLLTVEEASHYTMVGMVPQFEAGGFFFEFVDSDRDGVKELVVNAVISLDTVGGIKDYVYDTDAGACGGADLSSKFHNRIRIPALVQAGVLRFNDDVGVPTGEWYDYAHSNPGNLLAQTGTRDNPEIFVQKPCLNPNN
jgi:hypothetical protein